MRKLSPRNPTQTTPAQTTQEANDGRKNGRQERWPVPVLGRDSRPSEPRLVAGRAGRFGPPPELQFVRSDGRGFRLRQGVQDARPRRRDQGPACPDDRLAGVVAGRLRPLRRSDDPHGMAQRGHLPRHRRARWGRRGPAALCATQQLAGQREPRQGAPALVANQQIRPEDLLG
jgi:hypothetical protein